MKESDNIPISNIVLKEFPFPIAYYYKKIIESERLGEKLEFIFKTYEISLHYLGLILSVYYLDNKKQKLPINLLNFFYSQIDDWLDIIEKFSYLKEEEQNIPIIKSIKEWYNKFSFTKIKVKEIINYRKEEKEKSCLEILRDIEKNIINSISLMDEKELEAYISFCYEWLEKILEGLIFFKDYMLLYLERKDKGKKIFKVLCGIKDFKRIIIEDEIRLKEDKIYIYDKINKKYINLYPFIIYKECYYCIKENKEDSYEVLFYRGRSEERLCYKGVFHNIAIRDTLEDYLEIVRTFYKIEKETKSLKDIWEKSFQFTEETLKYLENTRILENYWERKDKEYILDYFIQTSEKPLLNLVGEKGVGKSTLLGALSKRWLSEGEIVLFFNLVKDREKEIEKEIENCLEIEFKELISVLEENKKKIILIFDKIENITNPNLFFKYIRELLIEYSDYIKIILSINYLYFKLWYKDFSFLENFSIKFEDKDSLSGRETFYYYLDDLNQSDIKEIYTFIGRNYPLPITNFRLFSNNVKKLLSNLSILKLFLWSLKNKEVPRKLNLNEILEGFIFKYINFEKGHKEFLENLSNIVIELNSYDISLDSIIESGKDFLIKEILDISNFSVFFKLINEGTILGLFSYYYSVKDYKIFIVFSNSFMKDYLIYRYFASIGKYSDEFLQEYLRELIKGELIYYGVLFFSFLKFFSRGDYERIFKILSIKNEENEIIRDIFSNIFKLKYNIFKLDEQEKEDLNNFISKVLETSNKNIILALKDYIFYLFKKKKYKNISFITGKLLENDKILKILNNNNKEDGINAIYLYSIGVYSFYKIKEEKKGKKLLKKIHKLIKKYQKEKEEVSIELIDIYLFLAKFYIEIGEIEKAQLLLKYCYDNKDRIDKTLLKAQFYDCLGKIAENNEKYDKALNYYKKQENLYSTINFPWKTYIALENILKLNLKTKNEKNYIEILEDLCNILEDIGNIEELVEIKKEKGSFLYKEGKFKEAKDLFLEILPYCERLEKETFILDINLYLGMIFKKLEQPKYAEEYFKRLLQLNKLPLKYRAVCLENLGELKFNEKKLEESLKYLSEAKKIYTKINYKKGICNIFKHIGKIYLNKEDKEDKNNENLKKGIENLQEALEIAKDIKDEYIEAEIYIYLGNIYKKLKELDNSMEFIEKANNIYEKIDYKEGLGKVKIILSEIYKLQGKSSEALKNYKKAIEFLNNIENKSYSILNDIALAYKEIGLIYKERGDYYEAISNLKKSANIFKETNNLRGLARVYNNIGVIYESKNELSKALEYFEKDLKLTEGIGDKKGLADSYYNIGLFHYNCKNYPRALWNLEKALSLYEELNIENMVRIAKEKIVYIKSKI